MGGTEQRVAGIPNSGLATNAQTRGHLTHSPALFEPKIVGRSDAVMFHRLASGTAVSIVVFLRLTAAQAQDLTSHLIFFSSDPLTDKEVILLTNEDKKGLNKIEWPSGLPLYRELTLPPGQYKINLTDILSSFSVETSDKAATFLQIDKYSSDSVEKGVQIKIWQGQPNSAAKSTVNEIKKSGFTKGLELVSLGHFGNIINFNTEPPWPGPFTPTPKPPPPK